MPFEVGTLVAGKYRIERLLGQGGMGTVYQARHLLLDRSVALKQLRGDLTDHPAAAERLLREGRALARMRGRHIARVLDVEAPTDGPWFLVLEYLAGEDLATLVQREGRLSILHATNYLVEACEALAEAHHQGIVHRDIKPSNLFLTTLEDGSCGIKVIDFGISRQLDQSTALTQSRSILGSPCYMAPEQMRSNGQIDARSDIWALGVVFYELLTGQLPHQGNSVIELCASILESSPKSPRALRPEVPASVDAAIRRCLERDPAARFNSVAELAQAIAPFSGVSTERLAWILPEHLDGSEIRNGGAPRTKLPRRPPPDRLTQAEVAVEAALERRQPIARSSTILGGLLLIAVLLFIANLVQQRNTDSSSQSTAAPPSKPETVLLSSARQSLPPSPSVTVLPQEGSATPPSLAVPLPPRQVAPSRSAGAIPRSSLPARPATVATGRAAASSNALESDPVLQYGHY